MSNGKAKASEEQLIYANLLGKGTLIAFVLIIVIFAIYVSGVLPNVVAYDKIQSYWALRASDYIHQTNSPTGWDWVRLLNKGDMLNLIGVVILAGMTIICYLRLLPTFLKKKDMTYTIITIIEIVVLLFAASGILKAGGH
jgi:uncharacterized membrane protein